MKIAFIGLGNMGGGMAANLVKAGHTVRAFDLSEEALGELIRRPAVASLITKLATAKRVPDAVASVAGGDSRRADALG